MRWLATLVLAAGLLLPGRAGAFNDCDGGWFEIEALFADALPADGVLAFRGRGGGSLAALSVEVTIEGGAAIEGALEIAEHGIIVWRPSAPITPGQRYAAHLHSDGSVDDAGCFSPPPPDLDVDATFTAAPPGRPAPRWEAITVRQALEIQPSSDPADFVCCEGQRPDEDGCGGLSPGEGCAATRGSTALRITSTLDPAAWGEAGGQLLYEPFERDDTHERLEFVDATPLPCVTLRAIDLATHQEHVGPTICPDEASSIDLGERALDPRDALSCEGPLEVCDYAPFEYDPSTCRRWYGGCGCASDDPEPSLLALALLALAFTRRRQSSRE